MLAELSIRNFAIITELTLTFNRGFNVLTGETGAGKSIILDAVSLILGGRADTSFVRAGADKAMVEATFELSSSAAEAVQKLLAEHDLVDDDDPNGVTVSRELRSTGRNVCRINGSTVRVSLVRELGELLIGIHGQGEHLALLHPKAHQPLLDAYAGLQTAQKKLAEDVRALRGLERERNDLQQDARTRQQRIDMLRFQVDEIDLAQLTAGEEESLRQERTRLSNMEQLLQASSVATAVLLGLDDGETPSAVDLLGEAESSVATLARLDESQQEMYGRLQGLVSEFNDLAGEVRDYLENLEHDPVRLNEIEERLELISRLKRKYGDDIAEILALRDEAAAELDKIENSDERLAELQVEIDKKLRDLGGKAAKLSQKRQKSGERLSRVVEKELGHLKMKAQFGVQFSTVEDPEGLYVGENRYAFDHTGYDKLEFMISANPGEPLKPMAKVASGGETARIMLALKTALAAVDSTPTLIFDEIDQGIGGRIGSIVGEKLWSLAGVAQHQVIVVTHLPQMAGFGDAHFHVRKRVQQGRTSTAVTQLDHQERVAELGAMLGTKEDLAIVGARSILQEARKVKESRLGA